MDNQIIMFSTLEYMANINEDYTNGLISNAEAEGRLEVITDKDGRMVNGYIRIDDIDMNKFSKMYE